MNEHFVEVTKGICRTLGAVPSLTLFFFFPHFVLCRMQHLMLKETSFSRLSLPSQLSKTPTS